VGYCSLTNILSLRDWFLRYRLPCFLSRRDTILVKSVSGLYFVPLGTRYYPGFFIFFLFDIVSATFYSVIKFCKESILFVPVSQKKLFLLPHYIFTSIVFTYELFYLRFLHCPIVLFGNVFDLFFSPHKIRRA